MIVVGGGGVIKTFYDAFDPALPPDHNKDDNDSDDKDDNDTDDKANLTI